MKSAMVILLALCLALTGCSTTRLVPLSELPAEVRPAVRVGERLQITLKSGEELELKVTEIGTGTVTGKRLTAPKGGTVQIAMKEVRSISARRFSGRRTTGLVLGAIAGVVLVLFAALQASLSCSGDSSCD